MKVTGDTLIGEVLDMDVQTARYFMEIGMHCIGCPSSRNESISEACLVHGLNGDDEKKLIDNINKYLESK